MIDTLIQMVQGWSVGWQFFFVIIFSGLLTQITCALIHGVTRDFMHSLAVLFRGWPVDINDLSDDDDETDQSK